MHVACAGSWFTHPDWLTHAHTRMHAAAATPPMGWMSWEIFRCNLATPTDNCTDPETTMCISEALYKGQADAMASRGFAAAGYASIHMDDCWEEKVPCLLAAVVVCVHMGSQNVRTCT